MISIDKTPLKNIKARTEMEKIQNSFFGIPYNSKLQNLTYRVKVLPLLWKLAGVSYKNPNK